MTVSPENRSPISWRIKRIVDIVGGSLLAVLAIVPLAVAALLVRVFDGPPVFFVQTRIGYRGRAFRAYKFRTMQVHATPVLELGQVDGSHPLVTPFGRFLRISKLDELPQIWNVVRGDMSLVGPRPTVPEVIHQGGELAQRRSAVPPGMTGWAQVNGNVLLSWRDRYVLDAWYVAHWSLMLDVRILWRTVAVVLRGERINHAVVEAALAECAQS